MMRFFFYHILLLCACITGYAQQLKLPIKRINTFYSKYFSLTPIFLMDVQEEYRLPQKLSGKYMLKIIDFNVLQTAYTRYSHLPSKRDSIYHIYAQGDTDRIIKKKLNTYTGVLIYREKDKLCFVVDTDNNKDFNGDKIFRFEYALLKKEPEKFKGVIKVPVNIQRVFRKKVFNQVVTIYIHPAKIKSGFEYLSKEENDWFVAYTADENYMAEIDKHHSLLLTSGLMFNRYYNDFFTNYLLKDSSIFLSKYYRLHDIIPAGPYNYRIDSITPNLTWLFVTRYKSADSITGADTGMYAPFFAPFSDLEGRAWDMGRFRGKYTLLDFWGTWCSPCIEGIPKLKEIDKDYQKKGLQKIPSPGRWCFIRQMNGKTVIYILATKYRAIRNIS
jgi:AhpC/TSA family